MKKVLVTALSVSFFFSVMNSAHAFPFGGLGGFEEILESQYTGKIGAPRLPKANSNLGDQSNKGGDLPSLPSSQDCEGGQCDDINSNVGALTGQTARLNANSSYSDITDSMFSPRLTGMFEDGKFYTSPFVVKGAVLASASRAVESGMKQAFDLSVSLSQARSVADMAVQNRLQSSGTEGRKLWEALENCKARLTARGVSYAAAQETCFNQWKKTDPIGGAPLITDESVDPSKDNLSFKHHPSHPNYELIRPGFPAVRNIDRVRDYFKELSGAPGSLDQYMLLSYMIFVPPVIEADKGSDSELKETMKRWIYLWRLLFGDVKYSYLQKTATDFSPYIESSIQVIKPEFSYNRAVRGLNPHVDLDSAQQKISPYIQFTEYKKHYIYYRLWNVLSRYCRYKVKATGGGGGGGGAVNDALFWTPIDGAGVSTLTSEDVQALSTSFYLFQKDFGQNLYKIVSERATDGETEAFCDSIDPSKEDGVTSLKALVQGKATPTDAFNRTRQTVLEFASVIAADHVNEFLARMTQFVQRLSGGDFEADARKTAMALLSDNVGADWNYDAAEARIQATWWQMRDVLIQQASNIPK